MKNVLKQLGKAACYYGLFLGMQVMVTVVVMVVCTVIATMELAVESGEPNVDLVTELATEYTLQNMNLIGIASGCLSLLALWIFFLIRKKKITREVGVSAISGKNVVMMILLGLTMATTVSFGMGLLPESWLEAYAEQSSLALGSSTILMVISNMIVAPIVEEVIFRGLILSRLRKAMPLAAAVAITSALFGLAHGQILWIVYTAVVGAVFAIAAARTNSLTTSIVLHMAFNVFGTVVPALFGNVESTVVYAVIAAAGAVLSALILVGFFKTTKQVQA